MKENEYLDDQVLAAFVDGVIDAEITETIINSMDRDMDVRERVYKLRRSKDLMKLAYGSACAPSNTPSNKKTSLWKRFALSIAASLTAISIVLCTGASGYYFGQHKQYALNINPSSIYQNSNHILLHISESDTKQFSAALSYAENFLNIQEPKGRKIAVVANSTGLDILRAGVSPFEKKIRNMIKKYDNVFFIACANSIRNLREKGIEPVLIDKVRVEKPAMDHIISYVQKGWTYKKVQSLVKI